MNFHQYLVNTSRLMVSGGEMLRLRVNLHPAYEWSDATLAGASLDATSFIVDGVEYADTFPIGMHPRFVFFDR